MVATSRTPCESSSQKRPTSTSQDEAANAGTMVAEHAAGAWARDRVASLLARASAPLTVALAETAAAFLELGGGASLGYGHIADFTRERMGRSGRWLRDLAMLGQ